MWKGTIVDNVINLAERTSKAASVFPPIITQREIDNDETRKQRAFLVRRVRWWSLAASVIAAGMGLQFMAGGLLLAGLFPRAYCNLIWGKLDD